MAETVNQETNGTAAETQENEQRTFTQAEMNAIIQDRLTRERGKYADYEALKAKAAKFDEAEEAHCRGQRSDSKNLRGQRQRKAVR